MRYSTGHMYSMMIECAFICTYYSIYCIEFCSLLFHRPRERGIYCSGRIRCKNRRAVGMLKSCGLKNEDAYIGEGRRNDTCHDDY